MLLFIKKDTKVHVQPRQAGTCPCKHSDVQLNNHSCTHTAVHAFTSACILMSQRQCHTCRGHSFSHLPFPSQFSQVGNPGTFSSPGLITDSITPSFTGSCPSDWDAFISRRKAGRAFEGTSFQICPSHPQHSQYHTPTPQDTGHSPSHSIPRPGPCTHPASVPQCCAQRHLSQKAPKPTEHLGFPWRPPQCPKAPGIDKTTCKLELYSPSWVQILTPFPHL